MKYILICLMISHFGYSQILTGLGARSEGLGGASLTLSDTYSILNNQAAMATLSQSGLGVGFENRFHNSHLPLFSCVAVLPVRHFVGGLGLLRIGDEQFNQTRASIGLSHKIGFVALGLGGEFLQQMVPNHVPQSQFLFHFGGIAYLGMNWKVAAHVFNVTISKFSENSIERIPTIMRLGVSYNPSKQLAFFSEIEKDVYLPLLFKLGMEYQITPFVYARTGLKGPNFTGYLGVGIKFYSFELNFTSSYGLVFGFGQYVSLCYTFPQIKIFN